jgi:hypothetical protein
MAEAVDVTGIVVAVVEIAAGEAEAEAAVADAISRVFPRPSLTAENFVVSAGASANCPGGRESVLARLARFTL